MNLEWIGLATNIGLLAATIVLAFATFKLVSATRGMHRVEEAVKRLAVERAKWSWRKVPTSIEPGKINALIEVYAERDADVGLAMIANGTSKAISLPSIRLQGIGGDSVVYEPTEVKLATGEQANFPIRVEPANVLPLYLRFQKDSIDQNYTLSVHIPGICS